MFIISQDSDEIIRDILIGIIQKYWDNKNYVRKAGHDFIESVSYEIIEDLEKNPDIDQNKILIKIFKAMQNKQGISALNPLKEALIKADYWTPESGTEIGPVKILADDVIDLLRNFGHSALPILIDAYLDDADFDEKIKAIPRDNVSVSNLNQNRLKERNFSPRTMLLSAKYIKNQRLREEIERHGHIALDQISERIKINQSGPIFEKLNPIYQKLQEIYMLDARSGYKLLL